MQNDFIPFTVYDREHPGLDRLAGSAKKFGWPLQLHQVPQKKYFLSEKHLLIRSFLEEHPVKCFLFVDAFDTVFIRKYHGPYFPDVLLGFVGEKNCYPRKEYTCIFKERADGPFPYLNSGIIWGDPEYYLAACPEEFIHDQLAWTRAAVEDHNIFIDSFGGPGINLHSTEPDDWSYSGGLWTYRPTMATPYVIHGNGNWPLPAWAEPT